MVPRNTPTGITRPHLTHAVHLDPHPLLRVLVHGLRRLKTVSPDKPLVVGSYAYLDGELHVRLSLAMDAIVKGLTESREQVMVSPGNHRRCCCPEPWL